VTRRDRLDSTVRPQRHLVKPTGDQGGVHDAPEGGRGQVERAAWAAPEGPHTARQPVPPLCYRSKASTVSALLQLAARSAWSPFFSNGPCVCHLFGKRI
jgi:hypothetical protein